MCVGVAVERRGAESDFEAYFGLILAPLGALDVVRPRHCFHCKVENAFPRNKFFFSETLPFFLTVELGHDLAPSLLVLISLQHTHSN
jgi:hypothetical protein